MQYACLSDKHEETTCISRKTIEDILLYATSCNIHWRSEIGKEQRGEEIQNIDRDINQKFKTFIIYASSNMKSSPEAKTHNPKRNRRKENSDSRKVDIQDFFEIFLPTN